MCMCVYLYVHGQTFYNVDTSTFLSSLGFCFSGMAVCSLLFCAFFPFHWFRFSSLIQMLNQGSQRKLIIFKIECLHSSGISSAKMKSCMPKSFFFYVNYLHIIVSHCLQTLCLNILAMNLKSLIYDSTGNNPTVVARTQSNIWYTNYIHCWLWKMLLIPWFFFFGGGSFPKSVFNSITQKKCLAYEFTVSLYHIMKKKQADGQDKSTMQNMHIKHGMIFFVQTQK